MCYIFEEESEPGVCKVSWKVWLILWVLLNVSPVWFTIYVNKKIDPPADLDPKYKPFARIDYKNWSYLTVLITHFFFIPRYILCVGAWCSLCLVTSILLIGHKKGEPYKKWQLTIIRNWSIYTSGVLMFFAGYVVMRKKRVKYDYSKWLGPDSKLTFEGAGIYISNHSSPFDTPLC